ncbi:MULTISPECIES: hypothetical protein [Vibrio]|uniref:Uncharacterized protein n=1 Tax=Vibrio celticus TaxID=446372 RepID=A0A1C3JKJ0_9VIBR|nr:MULTISPECIES: hypothetical protein [Vibrio]ROO70728.1 hypothetical protein EDB53_2848 [Vibrio crassostreae]ROR69174.1 hypothetical protein EDB54_2836 [Vibrio crassostreae]SBT15673.1 hypothetical protein VCE7224_04478 [Vibrio celticus]
MYKLVEVSTMLSRDILQNLGVLAGLAVYFVVFGFMLKNRKTRHTLFQMSSLIRSIASILFIIDPDDKHKPRHNDSDLLSPTMEKQVIRELLDKGLTKKIVQAELENYCNERVDAKVRQSLRDNNELSDSYRVRLKKQELSAKLLHSTLTSEQRNSASMKSRLTNLFILFTLVMLGANFVYGNDVSDTNKILVGITYITLSSFLIFIIRTSHQRSAMLIAIQEDLKKQSELFEFFSMYKKGKDLTEHDIEFLRLLMTSRAERERNTSHPFEVILKNVNGSNIQLGKSSIKLGQGKSNGN